MSSKVVPSHIGIIMDGNRRWAKDRGLSALEGHRKGYEVLKTISEAALDRGVKYITAFAFSTENWNRTKEEVGYLMDLAYKMVSRDLKEMHQKNIRIVWLGSEERISKKLIKALKKAVETTKNNTKGTLALCFNYGGKEEIVQAMKNLMNDGVKADDITEEKISKYLYTPDVPPIDIMVRTSGEQRISNFMLWRVAYSELMFVDKHWPDFDEQDLDNVIKEFGRRQRRFGS
jgi:undecaprenyl diphosphate synthase